MEDVSGKGHTHIDLTPSAAVYVLLNDCRTMAGMCSRPHATSPLTPPPLTSTINTALGTDPSRSPQPSYFFGSQLWHRNMQGRHHYRVCGTSTPPAPASPKVRPLPQPPSLAGPYLGITAPCGQCGTFQLRKH